MNRQTKRFRRTTDTLGVIVLKKPDFDTFRAIFLACLERYNSSAVKVSQWQELGGIELRRQILESVNQKLMEGWGLSFEVNSRLLQLAGPVESVIIQAYHEFNTIYMMEKINEKIRARLN